MGRFELDARTDFHSILVNSTEFTSFRSGPVAGVAPRVRWIEGFSGSSVQADSRLPTCMQFAFSLVITMHRCVTFFLFASKTSELVLLIIVPKGIGVRRVV